MGTIIVMGIVLGLLSFVIQFGIFITLLRIKKVLEHKTK